MANTRYKLTQDVYMNLGGQWQIVLCGTVFDDDSAKSYSSRTADVVAETAGSLGTHGKATPVRNVRTK